MNLVRTGKGRVLSELIVSLIFGRCLEVKDGYRLKEGQGDSPHLITLSLITISWVEYMYYNMQTPFAFGN